MATIPIQKEDRVVVRGRYLVYEKDPSRRFWVRGMAFPVPLDPKAYHEDGWIDVMKQLREASPYLNTLRLYQIPLDGMSGFYQAAADLGFYLLLPLTSSEGEGVLDRNRPAPDCYPPALFHYGVQVVDSFQGFPNILGGVVGNEVLNSLSSWKAAPCLLAYAKDLKDYDPSLTLIYTTQHDGIGAAISPSQAAQLLLDYLTCDHSMDILGINIESWCSSLTTFDQNEDGSLGTYKDLYQHLENTTIPILYSEVGCPQFLFNRDNGLPKGSRDWKQLSAISEQMLHTWSGYIAYAYDGPKGFSMTTGGPWKGIETLEFNRDMDNFLKEVEATSLGASDLEWQRIESKGPSCQETEEYLQTCCDLNLLAVQDVPSHYVQQERVERSKSFLPAGDSLLSLGKRDEDFHRTTIPRIAMALVAAILSIMTIALFYYYRHKRMLHRYSHAPTPRTKISRVHHSTYDTFL